MRSRAPLLLPSQYKVLAVDKAFKVLRCMLDAGVKPNVVTFNCLIDACGRTQQLDKAFHVLQVVMPLPSLPSPFISPLIAPLIPPLIPPLIDTTAFHVLQLMHHYESPPDAVTFSCAASHTLCLGTSCLTHPPLGQTKRT